MTYRVAYRMRASEPWQTQPCADRAAASAFQHIKRRQGWAAVVQWWNEREERWIG